MTIRVCCLALGLLAAFWSRPNDASTTFTFALSAAATTSAGVYSPQGVLVRTLWRGTRLAAGTYTRTWDGLDDHGDQAVPGVYQVRVLQHNVQYIWEGVIGNTSASFTGSEVHHAYLPIFSLAIAGNSAYYAVEYNEGQRGTHSFDTANPQYDVPPLNHPDPFTSWSMVATDGLLVYWANTAQGFRATDGMEHPFVAASNPRTGDFWTFSAGSSICLNRNGSSCWPDQSYTSVIDTSSFAPGSASTAATGIAVQAHGHLLAVAHGGRGVIELFDKTTGARVGSFSAPLTSGQYVYNQIASAPNGDLWVISGSSVLRYTNLPAAPSVAARITGLSHPLAVAVHPGNNDLVLVADGGGSQQVKAFDSLGNPLWAYGRAGGFGSDPTVAPDKLMFLLQPGIELSTLAVQPDGSFWVTDTADNRLLHISAQRTYLDQIAYLPASYSATADPNDPQRVFSNFLEFHVDDSRPLSPGAASWTLVRNWLAGLPDADANSFNGRYGGLQTVVTIAGASGRTYALMNRIDHSEQVLELPATGPARDTGMNLPSQTVLYENGDLGTYELNASAGTETVMRQALMGTDADGNPQWAPRQIIATVPALQHTPQYRGWVFTGVTGPRFPITATDAVIFLDQSVNGRNGTIAGDNDGFHLGAAKLNGSGWLWQASPTGVLDGLGTFQTKRIDGTINYGGNLVWAYGRNVIYGFHGELFTNLTPGTAYRGWKGEANQFMHFYDDGLFIGQFGTLGVGTNRDAQVGLAGNAFSNIMVHAANDNLYWYHNDESNHGGVHRWRIDNWRSPVEESGSGPLGGTINLAVETDASGPRRPKPVTDVRTTMRRSTTTAR